MKIGSKIFDNGTHVMAIINLTPDSFFAPSRKACDSALFAVERAVSEGAAVIDIGAQSTRPGYTEVSAEEELSRLEKPLTEIKRRFEIPVSVDTYYAEVARAALSLGADMINDIWGLTRTDMAETIAEFSASVCIMHNSENPLKGDIWPQILGFLEKQTNRALAAGISKDKICLDGGIGFAKDRAQNLELLSGYGKLNSLGYPTLLGASRKSLFGGEVFERLPQTLEATRHACRVGVRFVRVHDVAENVRAIKEING